jgi:hypothetical protein
MAEKMMPRKTESDQYPPEEAQQRFEKTGSLCAEYEANPVEGWSQEMDRNTTGAETYRSKDAPEKIGLKRQRKLNWQPVNPQLIEAADCSRGAIS